MSRQREKYLVNNTDFFAIRNRNETRVIDCIKELLDADADLLLSEGQIYDIYACALNFLPARYAQRGTIILRDPVRKDGVRKAVKDALHVVLNNPKD